MNYRRLFIDIELRKDTAQVRADSELADLQLLGHVCCCIALRDHPEDLQFAASQAGGVLSPVSLPSSTIGPHRGSRGGPPVSQACRSRQRSRAQSSRQTLSRDAPRRFELPVGSGGIDLLKRAAR